MRALARRFAGRIALVTGAASGIGRATAARLAAEGAQVAIVDRDEAGLLGLTRHLAFDYGPKGIRVNAVCPGGVDTPMLRAAGVAAARSEEEQAARAARMAAYQFFTPIEHVSQPEEQAAVIAFLASDDASYVNGVSLDVNGGLFMA